MGYEKQGQGQVAIGSQGIEVPTETIASLMSRFDLNHIDLLKLDVEGTEFQVVSAGVGNWLGKVGTICLETHGSEIEKLLIPLLTGAGFSCARFRNVWYCTRHQFCGVELRGKRSEVKDDLQPTSDSHPLGRNLLMKSISASAVIRKLLWRVGRTIYAYARGDGENDPRTNGEYWLLEHVLKALPGPQVLLDVGANKGDWTAQALGLVQASKEVHVHAFEPSLATRSVLAARFGESVAVTVHPYALSETVGEATFYSNEDGAGTNSLSPSSGLNVEVVKVVTIDLFLRQAGIEAVSMMKIDTEGFDLLVLKGAEKSLHDGRIDIVQFEYNWRWLLNHACLRDVFDLISGKPYRFGKLVGNAVEFYDQWHFELDRYFESNYVLVRKGVNLGIVETEMHFDGWNTATRDQTQDLSGDAEARMR